MRINIVPVASVASETKTVSHPTKTRYERKPGTIFPLIPKIARDCTIVGAFDLLPASELKPTNVNERTVPIIAAQVACQKEMPKPRKKEPYDRASSDTFAPHHGQNKEEAFPVRSDSEITFVPFSSKFNLSSLVDQLCYEVGNDTDSYPPN